MDQQNTQQLTPLTAICPFDGRYWNRVSHLSEYFSEFALMKERVSVEIKYFQALSKENLFKVTEEDQKIIESLNDYIEKEFTIESCEKIKEIESSINHDVKAVEYFVKDVLVSKKLAHLKEYVHFALTSQDINNTAIPLLLKRFIEDIYIPQMNKMIINLQSMAEKWIRVPMLARTHGQPATPITVGRALYVFIERLETQVECLKKVPFTAKFGGATGGFNAHHVAFPFKDWQMFADLFVIQTLGLSSRQQYTTQIEHYDQLANLFDTVSRINTILINMCRDIWSYISMDYFKQEVVQNEVGSSAMPHKVNPIDFENAEANLGLANAVFHHLSSKLPISRLQRDLTDSSVLRNLGYPFSATFIALNSIERGLKKLILNQEKIDQDLNDNWPVISEAIQTILKVRGYEAPYELLKQFTRGKTEKLGQKHFTTFIEQLKIDDDLKTELKSITPFNYIGMF